MERDSYHTVSVGLLLATTRRRTSDSISGRCPEASRRLPALPPGKEILPVALRAVLLAFLPGGGGIQDGWQPRGV